MRSSDRLLYWVRWRCRAGFFMCSVVDKCCVEIGGSLALRSPSFEADVYGDGQDESHSIEWPQVRYRPSLKDRARLLHLQGGIVHW